MSEEVSDMDLDEDAVSVEFYVRGMEDGDVLRLADDFAELVAHPAWVRLGELVRVHQRRIRAGSTSPTWNRLLMGKPIADLAPLYVAAGRVRGMDEVVSVVNKVLRRAERLRAEIDKSGE